MFKTVGLSVLLFAALLAAGCLQKETSHTLYLAPDASVVWVASESDVRSNEVELGKRMSEEQDYIGPALLGSHGVARALRALEPQGLVRTTVVRDERPFHVVTEARFTTIDRLLERLFTAMEIRTSASLVRDADTTTLRVKFDFRKPMSPQAGENPVEPLLDNLEHLRIVLTEGRFAAVSGFDVADGGSATLSADWLVRAEKAAEAKTAIELTLSWKPE